jgi:BlaI family transcriptional regulator, penicillinase repressor
MKKSPRISETEWQIMKVIWRQSPISAAEIIGILQTEDSWHPKTAKTLLNRLVKKGAVRFEKNGRAYSYSPAVKESDCVKIVTESFLQRVFNGALTPMLAHFVEHRKLSATEIRELKQLLEETSANKK